MKDFGLNIVENKRRELVKKDTTIKSITQNFISHKLLLLYTENLLGMKNQDNVFFIR